MSRFMLFFVCCLLAGGAAAGHARQVVDQAGRTVAVPDPIRRVVSLAPSITEIVYQLGRQDLLKGATLYSDTPPEAKLLPRVGSYVRIDVEKVIALKPDLCLAIKDGNPLHTIARLESLGIAVYVVNPRNLDEIVEMIIGLGILLEAEKQAEVIAADMRQRIRKVVDRLDQEAPRPGVFFQIDAEPIVSAGRGTFIHELIVTAGGRNLAADAGTAYPKLSWEDVLQYRPEVAIVASMAGGHSRESLLSGWYKWPQLPAVKNNRIHVVDAGLVDRPTPRLIEGLETFSRLIHPELYSDQDE